MTLHLPTNSTTRKRKRAWNHYRFNSLTDLQLTTSQLIPVMTVLATHSNRRAGVRQKNSRIPCTLRLLRIHAARTLLCVSGFSGAEPDLASTATPCLNTSSPPSQPAIPNPITPTIDRMIGNDGTLVIHLAPLEVRK